MTAVGGATGPSTAALSHTGVRRVAAEAAASNIGTWMQNVTLIALANQLAHSGAFVGLVSFAQLGPMLLASRSAGCWPIASTAATSSWPGPPCRAALSVVLAHRRLERQSAALSAGADRAGHRHGQRPQSPRQRRRSSPPGGPPGPVGAIAINSAAMNGSRVLGPLLAALVSSLGTGWIFMINTGSLRVRHRRSQAAKGGVCASRTDGAVGPMGPLPRGLDTAGRSGAPAVLGVVSLFSLCSLVFITSCPAWPRTSWASPGSAFYRLFAAFGLGRPAAAPSLLGTVLGGPGRCTGAALRPARHQSRSAAFAFTPTRWPPTSLSLRSASSASPW
ncbi:MAG: hypothetical protein IPN02_14400 [Candidatus Microthrix sp.]|uniref:Uncharacterized protein n=1 Tax=Candidatus Neomicrothrix subdominans TaxID=2954438 RepID=A0A936NFK5_9ACTN|nr:hypothetical protein [Candidatus Microthrix subdominans]